MNVGIIGIGTYIPSSFMSASDISMATKGVWNEQAVIEKLGIVKKPVPGKNDGTQEMAVKAALNALDNSDIEAKDIDVILCIGEEWKEYPLSTSALYIQDKIGAINAWGIDVQNRCCTSVSAMKLAKSMLIADDDVNVVMIVGGYRNGDFVDYENKDMSMMYNLGAGAGALILKSDVESNVLLGSHIIGDGSLSRDAYVEIGGINNPITTNNIDEAYKSLRVVRPDEMKARLNDVSMKNWFICIDKALEKSNLSRNDIDYVAILHFKRSMHDYMISELGLTNDQTIYLEDYGHIGQIDQILSLELGLKQNKIKKGSNILFIAAGIGYVWAANVVRWG